MPDLMIRDHRGVVTTYRRDHDGRGPVYTRTLSLAEALAQADDEGHWTREDFAAVLTDPDDADEIERCERCETWEHNHDTTWINGGSTLWCDACVDDHAASCSRCGETGERDMESVGLGVACHSCYHNYTSWCADCEVNYWTDDGGHDHDEDTSRTCCSSPMVNFSIPVVSEVSDTGRLDNDTMAEVVIADGIVSGQGQIEIMKLLMKTITWDESIEERHELAVHNDKIRVAVCEGIGDEYKTKDGKYAKRLRSALHKVGITLTPAEIEKVGNLARDHSKGVTLQVAITRELDLSPEEFAHEDSCWWQSYSYSRCTLKSNAGFGLRSFIEHSGWTEVSGRAWVIPVAESDDLPGRLRPTFGEPQAYILFNSYGDLDERIGVRTLSAMTGMPWQQSRSGDWSMYVNGDSVFLVAPQDLLDRVREGNLTLPYSLSQHAGLYDRERDSLPRQASDCTVTIH